MRIFPNPHRRMQPYASELHAILDDEWTVARAERAGISIWRCIQQQRAAMERTLDRDLARISADPDPQLRLRRDFIWL